MAESKTTPRQTGSASPIPGNQNEFPCPDCGEMVRDGLVRCWNCGGFLRPELEREFQKIQSRPQRIIYSPPTDEEGLPDLDTMMGDRPADSTDDEEGGFELSGSVVAPARRVAPTAPPVEEASPPPADEPARPSGSTADEIPHSVATGGDVLLQLAAQEEIERLKRRGEKGSAVEGVKPIRDGFLIDAPKGCRIQVRDERTGEMRRITFGSSSRVRISLLDKLEAIQKEAAAKQKEEPTGPKHLSAGVYQRWMSGVHLHTLNPEKLKLKADSLAKEFVPVEIGFATDHLLVASLAPAKAKKGGLFSKGDKGGEKPADPRTAMLDHFRAGKSVADAPAGEKKSYTADQAAQLRIVQPAASLTESLFHGIPVFGTGRIAVQLPLLEAGEQPQYLSFTLSEFREFAEIVGSVFSMAEFGHNAGIPLTDSFTEHKCHYSDVKICALEYLSFYQADPKIELTIAGWLCGACGLVVSEDARAKEKLGGKGGKGIAKAKCPKCTQKMGHNPLYTLKSAVVAPSMTGEEPSETQPAAAE
ncbi:MAG: hypothetical protein AB7U20_06590 [Planctomycetaceae bacterium]